MTGTTRETTNKPKTQHMLPNIFPNTDTGTISPYLKQKNGIIPINYINLFLNFISGYFYERHVMKSF